MAISQHGTSVLFTSHPQDGLVVNFYIPHNRRTPLQAEEALGPISIPRGSRRVRAGLSDTILKGTHPGTTPARFGLIWFSGFRGEDLNVIFYQNMPNLHNRYKSAERKITQKNPEYMLNYSLPCRCS